MRILLLVTGLGQIALAVGSLWLPWLLRWREQTARLEPLTRAVFWVYACYILGTNLCLGGVTTFAPELLLDRSTQARLLAGYAFLYWGARLLIQNLLFRALAPRGRGYAFADAVITLGFLLWTAVYGAVAFDLW
jgi:hypothetical protein